jgi:hypothetical protein
MRWKIGKLITGTNEIALKRASEFLFKSEPDETVELYFETPEQLYQAIVNDEVQIGIGYLSEFPIFSNEDEIVIAGISERAQYGYGLLKSVKNTANIKIQNLGKEHKVLVNNRLAYEQITQFIDSDIVELLHYEDDEVWGLINNDEHLLILVDRNFTMHNQVSVDSTILIPIHPAELTGKAGLGIFAFLTHKDALDYRKFIHNLTNPKWIRISNIERSIQNLMGNELGSKLGVYCSTDQKGNYRVTAVALEPYRRVNVSQSTHVGLAEKVVQLLQIA